MNETQNQNNLIKKIINKYFNNDNYRMIKFKFSQLPSDKIKIIEYININIINNMINSIKDDNNLNAGVKTLLSSKLNELKMILNDLIKIS